LATGNELNRSQHEPFRKIAGNGAQKLLSDREIDVLTFAAKGWTDGQISDSLGLAKDTVASCWRRILAKYHAASRTEAVASYISSQALQMISQLETALKESKCELADLERKACVDELTVQLINNLSSTLRKPLLEPADLQDAFGLIMECILRVTGSEIGFLCQVQSDSSGPFLKSYNLSGGERYEISDSLYWEQFSAGVEFRKMDSLYGRVVFSDHFLISNEPLHDRRFGGTAIGHPPISSFAGIPLRIDSECVGVIGLANRPNGYTFKALSEVESLVELATSIFDRYRRQSDTA
jgi:DNA-binding CsgD family transcriptional regulator